MGTLIGVGAAHDSMIWGSSRHRGSSGIYKAAAGCCGHHPPLPADLPLWSLSA